MPNEMDMYEYVWSDADGPWALMCVNNEAAAEVHRYLIVNRMHHSALIIEDNRISGQVIQRMLSAGVPIIFPDDFQ